MKSSEDAIEKVMAGLRDADAPAGMERRILDAMEKHESARYGGAWRRLRAVWPPRSPSALAISAMCGCALTVVFALALAIPIMHRRGDSPMQVKRASVPVETQPSAPSVATAETTEPSVLAPHARSKRKVNTRRVGLAPDHDSVALREMRAASRPAPPLPLTEQERLLVSYVQTHSREELAAINPRKWAARDAEERAQFDIFFGPSTKGRAE